MVTRLLHLAALVLYHVSLSVSPVNTPDLVGNLSEALSLAQPASASKSPSTQGNELSLIEILRELML